MDCKEYTFICRLKDNSSNKIYDAEVVVKGETEEEEAAKSLFTDSDFITKFKVFFIYKDATEKLRSLQL